MTTGKKTKVQSRSLVPRKSRSQIVTLDDPVQEQSLPAFSAERIASVILLLRGQKVILDSSLADLYKVETRALVQAVKRNLERFPGDFMFQLTELEVLALRSQAVISKSTRGKYRRYAPYAFTEQGVAMLSTVLRSPRAIQVNVEVMRAFVRLRRMLESNADLARKLDSLEKKYDEQFKVVFQAIRELMLPTPAKKRRIGYRLGEYK